MILIRIPPIRNPLNTKKIETPSKTIYSLISFNFNERRFPPWPKTTKKWPKLLVYPDQIFCSNQVVFLEGFSKQYNIIISKQFFEKPPRF